MNNAYVYILHSELLDRYYVGSTNDFTRREKEHALGMTPSTRSGRPWTCVFIQAVSGLYEARKLEKRLKSWKSRVLLERVIREGFIHPQ